MALVAALVVGAIALPACAGETGADGEKPPAGGTTVAGQPPSLAKRCGSSYAHVRARRFWFRANDGTRLAGAMLGNGRSTVVLATEYPADQCGWLDYARTLENAGLTVYLFDFRGLGASSRARRPRAANRYQDDVVAAVAEARRRGASRILLVGASLGGTAVMVAAPSIRPPVAAVASLSGEANLQGFFPGAGLDALSAMRRLRVPLLVMVSRDDRYISVSDARRLHRSAAARDKKLYVFPGSYHGWSMLYAAPYNERASRTLLAFLRAHA